MMEKTRQRRWERRDLSEEKNNFFDRKKQGQEERKGGTF